MTQRDTKWITTTLALCTASTGPQILALSLLMPELTQALDSTVPQMGQLNTVFSIIATIGSLIMGAITLRFPSKRLLMAGVTMLLVGIGVAASSTTYTQMIIAFILYGVGCSLVLPIVGLLLVLYPIQQRTTAMGRIYSGRSLTSILATPVISFLTVSFGWRIGYLGFGAPLIALAIILVTKKISEMPVKQGTVDLMSGFRKVAANRNALACLAGASLGLTFFNSLMVFNGTYIRNHLGIPIETAGVIMSLTFIAVALGQVLSGRLVDRLGVKTTTWVSTLIGGLSLLSYFSLPLPLPIAILASVIGTGMAGTTMTTMVTLALVQEPESSATMMSLNSAAMNLGTILSTAIGGIAISSFGFTGYGAIMFTLSLASVIAFYTGTKGPS